MQTAKREMKGRINPQFVITLVDARKILESDANTEYFITVELRKFVDEHEGV